MSIDELKIQSLLDEYINVTDHIYDLQIAQYTIGGAIIALFTTVYATNLNKNNFIRILLPFALTLIYIAYLVNYNEIRALGGYKMFVGEKLNCLLGERLFLWELLVKQHSNNSNIILPIAGVIFFFLLIISMYNSANKIEDILDSEQNQKIEKFFSLIRRKITIKGLLYLVFSALIILIAINIINSWSIKNHSYESAKSLYTPIKTVDSICVY